MLNLTHTYDENGLTVKLNGEELPSFCCSSGHKTLEEAKCITLALKAITHGLLYEKTLPIEANLGVLLLYNFLSDKIKLAQALCDQENLAKSKDKV